MNTEYLFNFGEPFICTAIHNGHTVSSLVNDNLDISEDTRFREEDPETGYFTDIAKNKIICHQSRFEFDLNRSREKAVYIHPKDAWGLNVRREHPNDEQIVKSLRGYDLFYRRVKLLYNEMIETFGNFFVYDIHSYNHHRRGPNSPFDDSDKNPEIVLGTSNMDKKWLPLVDQIQSTMKEYNFFGRSIDVRQNVRFPGGYFSRWTHDTFPGQVCVIAIEFKKIFMDEWTGELYPEIIKELKKVLATTKPVIIDYLMKEV